MYALPPAVLPSRTPTGMTVTAASSALAQQVVSPAPTVVQKVAVEVVPSRTDLLVGSEDWTWAELRDYVVGQITDRFGPFPRDSRKEYGIFNRFLSEYGSHAVAIAQFAFGPVCDGWWGKAPISINRFCKASDPYFAQPILERIVDTAPA